MSRLDYRRPVLLRQMTARCGRLPLPEAERIVASYVREMKGCPGEAVLRLAADRAARAHVGSGWPCAIELRRALDEICEERSRASDLGHGTQRAPEMRRSLEHRARMETLLEGLRRRR